MFSLGAESFPDEMMQLLSAKLQLVSNLLCVRWVSDQASSDRPVRIVALVILHHSTNHM